MQSRRLVNLLVLATPQTNYNFHECPGFDLGWMDRDITDKWWQWMDEIVEWYLCSQIVRGITFKEEALSLFIAETSTGIKCSNIQLNLKLMSNQGCLSVTRSKYNSRIVQPKKPYHCLTLNTGTKTIKCSKIQLTP